MLRTGYEQQMQFYNQMESDYKCLDGASNEKYTALEEK
jgi:hypothetical protein